MIRTAAILLLLLHLASSPLALRAQSDDPELTRIEELLQAEKPDLALEKAQRLIKKDKSNAAALLLRSMAHAMLGDASAAYDDLEKAVRVDPGMRQAWLNLAGLEIAEGRFDAAYEALIEARKIDPSADDNHLNLGAVLLMSGRTDDAEPHFRAYLDANPESAEAAYLVASNYALRTLVDTAVVHLSRAIELDERMRLRARSDDRFLTLDASPAYRRLLGTDSWATPTDWHRTAAAFSEPYRSNDPKLVYAVLEALGKLGLQYDPNIEATLEWALIWGELRIKIYNQENGTGVVALHAPNERFSSDAWHRSSQEIFRAVQEALTNAEPRRPRLPSRR